ncbi:Spectrin beta chain, partial [Araneus ventricosus]
DVSGVELLMNNHQSLKAEIDTREDNISVCINLGKELLARNHYASNEIKEKLLSLTNQRTLMMDRWEERWEHLQLMGLSVDKILASDSKDCGLDFAEGLSCIWV